ncbi:uncharacterized protein LOC125229878 [Leguminivora glycinivorella]|uniref:uncharacterized protein LOC125229878 n=1 Tax=Leguminivora glycinivorella TaxID=1035111 RepID=UPI00201032AC|nr:uncharacterized protein LOC125229878 [Leguminivora glycinivorella]
MTSEIKFMSLQKAELAYEVEIRGESPADNVMDLRKQITKLVRLYPSDDILLSPFDPAVDAAAVEESLSKIAKNIKCLNENFDKNLLARTKNTMNHIFHRLNRIDCSSQPDSLTACNECFKLFQTCKSALNNFDTIAAGSTSEDTPSLITVNCERGLSSELSKLKFNGKTCVRSFIRSASDFIKARSLSSSKVLSFATEIFTDDALHWFRSIRDQVDSWEDVCVRLKEAFSTPNYDYRFKDEIKARTQGPRENITIYLSIMSGMFSQLDKPLPEEEKLQILLHNIRPCYANVLTSCSEIKDVQQLQSVCKNYENVQSRMAQYREPPKATSETLAPDFAYSHASTSTNASNKPFLQRQPFVKNYDYKSRFSNYANKPNTITNITPVDAVAAATPVYAINARPKFCPRCRVNTHSLRNCTAERVIVCFRCGHPGVKFHDCPDCQKQLSSSTQEQKTHEAEL